MTLVRDNNHALKSGDVLSHPLGQSAGSTERDRYKYKFRRVTREPTPDRPDSGRILVETHTGSKKEFYALLFGLRFNAKAE